MSVSTDDVEAIRSLLSALPRHQPKMLTKKQAIAALAAEIGAAQRRGYPAGDLAQLLSGRGIDVNGPMLRHYLRKIRKPRSRSSAPKTAKSAPAPEADSGTEGSDQGVTVPSTPGSAMGKREASPVVNGKLPTRS
jgi:hypothetical protein